MPQESGFPDSYLSVSEIGERAEEALLGTFPDPFWVKGEITNLSNQKNLSLAKNYIFCALKDENSQITLYIPASSSAFKLIPSLQDGTEVYVYGKINYYTKQNSISFRVFSLLVSGEGELRRQFELMKKRLQEEGLFDPQHKKPIPLFPRTIGVVTSSTGAAIQDILSRTFQPYGAVDVVLFPVAVQGKAAATEIAQAIEIANLYFKNTIDVLIVGRGGGSVEDLWAFNEEIVARAIFASEIPIISAVGHEVDWTIADYVADMRAPTPTAAAEHLMKEIIATNRSLRYHANTLWNILATRFQIVQRSLEQANPENLFALLEHRLTTTRKNLSNIASRLLPSLDHTIENTSLHLANLSEKMIAEYSKRIQKTKNTLLLLGEKIKNLDPLRTLERGYSLTYTLTPHGKKLLRSPMEVNEGDQILTRLANGEITSQVRTTTCQKTEKPHPNGTA
ncbi:Exodeoxyribonuclease VII large subunit [Brevinematales bacterium NS]|nr:exodeoxyribonuclease VII large subunit [Brevinematales bacterium]QJR23010.1 Exodeoxyribonuclease VII large subunit [Brevinematales bacterium NS]